MEVCLVNLGQDGMKVRWSVPDAGDLRLLLHNIVTA